MKITYFILLFEIQAENIVKQGCFSWNKTEFYECRISVSKQKKRDFESIKSGIGEISRYFLEDSDFTRNIAFSPLNILSGIKLLQKATSGNARNEFDNMFGQEDMQDFVNSIINSSNQTFVFENFNRIFYRELKGAQEPSQEVSTYIEKFDFTNDSLNPSRINDFVEERTKGKLTNVFMEKFPESSYFILVSSTYFKASWSDEFTYTRMNWHSLDDTTTYVTGFESTGSFYTYYQGGSGVNYRVFDLPMTLETESTGSNKSLSSFFRVWLPELTLKNNEQHKNFIKLIKESRDKLASKMSLTKLDVKMPRFSVKTTLKLTKFLEEKNTTTILSPGSHFNPIYGNKGSVIFYKIL